MAAQRTRECPFTGADYRATSGAGYQQQCHGFGMPRLKIGSDGVGAIHGDGGRGGIDIGDGIYVTGPLDKLVAFVRLSNEVDDHCHLAYTKAP